MAYEDKQFTDGLYPKYGHEKTPWIVTTLGIHKNKFIAWLQEQQENDGGYITVDICTAKQDPNRLYGVLNTYKSQKKEVKDEFEGYTSPDEHGRRIKVDDIGF